MTNWNRAQPLGHRVRWVGRREFMFLLAGATTTLGALRAQQKAMPVVGLLSVRSPGEAAEVVAAFRQGLAETGWVEGQNVAIDYCWAEGRYNRLPALAADLVSRKVDAIAAIAAPSALTAKSATSTIPIVFLTGTDPVRDGLVTSLARPGGNLTGISILTLEMMPKRLQLISELVPKASTIALLVNPNNPNAEPISRGAQEAARITGVQLNILQAGSEGEVDAAFASLIQMPAGALLVGTDPLFTLIFVCATILNFVPVLIAEPVPIEVIVTGFAHTLFIVRIAIARRDARRQRANDLAQFEKLKNENRHP